MTSSSTPQQIHEQYNKIVPGSASLVPVDTILWAILDSFINKLLWIGTTFYNFHHSHGGVIAEHFGSDLNAAHAITATR